MNSPRALTAEEYRRRERQLLRGFPAAFLLLALGTLMIGVIWLIASARRSTLESLGRPATAVEIDEVVRASSLEADLLLGGAALLWLGVIVAVASAHQLARLRSRAAQRR